MGKVLWNKLLCWVSSIWLMLIVAGGRDSYLFLLWPICMGKIVVYPLFFTSIVVSFTK